MKRVPIILTLVVCVLIGYAYEFMPSGVQMTFPFSQRTLISNWYYFILFKDIRSVLLVWLAWYLVPKNEIVLRLGLSIFAVLITFVPINFLLFYSAPFHSIALIVKIAASIIIGFFITYLNDRKRDDIDGRSF